MITSFLINLGYERKTVFLPVSMAFLFILFVLLIIFIPLAFILIGDLFVSTLGIHAQWVCVLLLISLFGSARWLVPKMVKNGFKYCLAK